MGDDDDALKDIEGAGGPGGTTGCGLFSAFAFGLFFTTMFVVVACLINAVVIALGS